jgi:hypothetical protein
MKLKDAGPHDANGSPAVDETGKRKTMPGETELAKDSDEKRAQGRKVFLDNCAICHSSKLPKNFDLRFTRNMPAGGWDKALAPADPNSPIYTLPMEYLHWDAFRKSPAMEDFRERIAIIAGKAPEAGKEDEFITNNFLSNELRIPITLTATYSGRAMATNATRGSVWDNYSSETFKSLDSVGDIRYFNPYKSDASAVALDPFGTNDQYSDGRPKGNGGPGYFRPATLISIWASAPFFHNNALGIYTHNTSVEGRLLAFDDAIRKLLWNSERPRHEREWGSLRPGHEHEKFTYVPPGDLRGEGSAAAANDPGYIYRLPVDTRVQFQPGFIRPIIVAVLAGLVGKTVGAFLFTVLSFWWWVVLALIFGILIFKGRARHAGVLVLLLALGLAAVLALTRMHGYMASVVSTMMMAATNMLDYTSGALWLVVIVLAVLGLGLMLARCEWKLLARTIFVVATVITLFAGILANKFLNGRLKQVNPLLAVLPNSWLNADYKGIDVGPIPRGTPVNLLMSLDPTKIDKVAPALVALIRATVQINKEHLSGEEAYKVLAEKAGPALMAASKCPDFVLDRGHWFGESLTNDEKEQLIAFLKTL